MGERAHEKQSGIQVARAVAALAIAYFHSWHVILSFPADSAHPIPLLKDYGYLAVNFFFAISGYVICMVVSKPGFSRTDFLIKRIFRIYPLWIAASFVFLHLAVTIRGMAASDTPAFIRYSLTLLPTQGYPFYDVGWSLQHEIAFYVLAAAIAPMFGLRALVCALAAGAAANMMFDLPWYLAQIFGYYPNFIAGIFAFSAYRYFRALNGPILIVAGLGVLSALIALPAPSAYPIAWFVMLLGFASLRFKARSLIEVTGVALGNASYSIYLFHPLVFLYIYGKLQFPLPPIWTEEFLRFGAIGVTCIFAVASWRFFETPFNRLGGIVGNAIKAEPKSESLPLSPRS